MSSLGLILLAAGGSSRLGQPKQLLPLEGMSLIRHACLRALATPHRPVVVVLGAQEEMCRRKIGDLPLVLTVNPDWPTGLASSLTLGLRTLEDTAPSVSGVLVLLLDQPEVTPAMLEKLVALWDPPKILIAATGYGEKAGVPAIFARRLFPELMTLRGDEGARKIIHEYRAHTAVLKRPEPLLDIDTTEDYQRMLRSIPPVPPP